MKNIWKFKTVVQMISGDIWWNTSKITERFLTQGLSQPLLKSLGTFLRDTEDSTSRVEDVAQSGWSHSPWERAQDTGHGCLQPSSVVWVGSSPFCCEPGTGLCPPWAGERMQNMLHHEECPETPSHKSVGNVKPRALLEPPLEEVDSP